MEMDLQVVLFVSIYRAPRKFSGLVLLSGQNLILSPGIVFVDFHADVTKYQRKRWN